jgi:hypothetical protein
MIIIFTNFILRDGCFLYDFMFVYYGVCYLAWLLGDRGADTAENFASRSVIL